MNVIILVIAAFFLVSCDSVVGGEGKQIMLQINTVDYFEKYDPPNTYWDWHSGRIEKKEIHNQLINACKLDFQKIYNEDLEFWEVYERGNLLFFVFRVKGKLGDVVAYEYDTERSMFLERFFIPMS